MAKIRVLRLIEYTYESMEAMNKDMGSWNLGPWAVKHTGSARTGDVSIRSCILPAEPFEPEV